MEMSLEKSHTKNWLVLLNACYVANTTLQCRNGTSIQPEINVVNIKLNNTMRAELVIAISNIRIELKREYYKACYDYD